MPRGKRPKISIKNNALKITSKYYESEDIYIERDDLIKNRENAIIKALTNRLGFNKDGEINNPDDLKSFKLINGVGSTVEITGAMKDAKGIKAVFRDLARRYGSDNKSHFWGDWIRGVRIMSFKNQDSENEYSSEVYKKPRKPAKKKMSKRELMKGRK